MNNCLLVPIAGNFNEVKSDVPYIFMPSPSGNILLLESLVGLDLDHFDSIILIVLKKYYDSFNIEECIEKSSFTNSVKQKITIYKLDNPTTSQPETIATVIHELDIKGFFCVKDPDNKFECNIYHGNYISTLALDSMEYVNPKHKSYLMLDENGYITNIIEQKIIGRNFCTGLYCFENADTFLFYFNKLSGLSRLYMSHIIYRMLLDNISFRIIESKNYYDWGTLHDWELYNKNFQTRIIKLDDLFLSGSFLSRDKKNKISHEKLDQINKYFLQGNNKIVITSNLPNSTKTEIEKFLFDFKVNYHYILTEVF